MFSEKVYQKLKEVPKGYVTTYKELAISLNCKAYRAVGNALNKNPYAPIVPCHRVVKSNSSLGGFALNIDEKIKLLQSEGIIVKDNKILNFKNKLWKF